MLKISISAHKKAMEAILALEPQRNSMVTLDYKAVQIIKLISLQVSKSFLRINHLGFRVNKTDEQQNLFFPFNCDQ